MKTTMKMLGQIMMDWEDGDELECSVTGDSWHITTRPVLPTEIDASDRSSHFWRIEPKKVAWTIEDCLEAMKADMAFKLE